MLLLTDPPQYLDIVQGTLGAFNTPTPTADQLTKILSIPLIPAEYADEFSFKLTVEHPDLHLPAPKKIELTDLDELAAYPQVIVIRPASGCPALCSFYGREFQLRRLDAFCRHL